jgi:hypothetical protein
VQKDGSKDPSNIINQSSYVYGFGVGAILPWVFEFISIFEFIFEFELEFEFIFEFMSEFEFIFPFGVLVDFGVGVGEAPAVLISE